MIGPDLARRESTRMSGARRSAARRRAGRPGADPAAGARLRPGPRKRNDGKDRPSASRLERRACNGKRRVERTEAITDEADRAMPIARRMMAPRRIVSAAGAEHGRGGRAEPGGDGGRRLGEEDQRAQQQKRGRSRGQERASPRSQGRPERHHSAIRARKATLVNARGSAMRVPAENLRECRRKDTQPEECATALARRIDARGSPALPIAHACALARSPLFRARDRRDRAPRSRKRAGAAPRRIWRGRRLGGRSALRGEGEPGASEPGP